jgi:hypothetical protein
VNQNLRRFIMRNNDPIQPWNDPGYKYDPEAPWNDPVRRNDPCEPWNDPGGTEEDLNPEDRKKYRGW